MQQYHNVTTVTTISFRDHHDLPYMCPDTHDFTSLALSSLICVGLVISYLPQHLRIIMKGSSEGFSPWYLLLGATSSACAMLDMWLLQWPVVKCCKVVSRGVCIENVLGLVQVTLQWFLFTVILILYLIYFPHHLKYQRTLPLPDDPILTSPTSPTSPRSPRLTGRAGIGSEETPLLNGASRGYVIDQDPDTVNVAKMVKIEGTQEWRLAVTLAWVVFIHLIILTLITALFIVYFPSTHPLTTTYTSILSLSSSLLAVFQYAPQLIRTYRHKVVGALSIGSMIVQVPGSFVFCASLAGREGVRWDAWGVYAVSGLMQGGLLVMCLLWKQRQKRLGIDDFGHPLVVEEQQDEERDDDVEPVLY